MVCGGSLEKLRISKTLTFILVRDVHVWVIVHERCTRQTTLQPYWNENIFKETLEYIYRVTDTESHIFLTGKSWWCIRTDPSFVHSPPL